MENSRVPKRKRPIGLFIFGWLLILSSLVHLHTYIFGYVWLCKIFDYWPSWLVNTRYCFSIVQRIAGLVAGIGLLYGNKVSRQIAMVIAIFTILTLYWKHPYQAFLNHCQMLDQQFSGIFTSQHIWNMSFVRLCIPALITHCLLDILFCGSLLYYLTRPSVKEYFEQSSRNE